MTLVYEINRINIFVFYDSLFSGDDRLQIESWRSSYRPGFFYIGIHAYCGPDIPNKDAVYTILVTEVEHGVDFPPDLWKTRSEEGVVHKQSYTYHRLCVPDVCNDVKLTLTHCTRPGPGCENYGFPELLVSKNSPHIKVEDEAWKLADRNRRTITLHPDDINMNGGHVYMSVYGWCTERDKCPLPFRPSCGPCDKAEEVKYKLTLEATPIEKKKCEKILRERSKRNNSNTLKFSYFFSISLFILSKMM